jgi:hypothetical protein
MVFYRYSGSSIKKTDIVGNPHLITLQLLSTRHHWGMMMIAAVVYRQSKTGCNDITEILLNSHNYSSNPFR